jgi:hypothetical protein
MGRQTGFHMLEEDCRLFLKFVQERDPVMVVLRDSLSPEIQVIRDPSTRPGLYCLWNQALLPSFQPKFVPRSAGAPFYTIDSGLPVVEFSYRFAGPERWNGRPALTQGRVWASFETTNKEFERWYNAIVRWIRKNFVKNPVPFGGFVGPSAYEWYKNGGILLPGFLPPLTTQWLSWLEAQDQHRAVFGK